MRRVPTAAFAVLALACHFLPAADGPAASGPKTGQKPGPYTFLVATGPERGQLTCYV
jgi:hypothetical protein